MAPARGVGLDPRGRLSSRLRGAYGSLARDLLRLGEAVRSACCSGRDRTWPGYGSGPSLGHPRCPGLWPSGTKDSLSSCPAWAACTPGREAWWVGSQHVVQGWAGCCEEVA